METVIRIKEYQIETPSPYFIGSIDGDKYRGLIVQSDSIIGCLEELKTSLQVADFYSKNKN